MKKSFLLFFFLFSIFSFSQRINEYEYVVIPEKFQFQRSPHEYQLNALLKCQLEEYGFKAFYSSELVNLRPEDRCLLVNANVINVSNIFMFKVMIEFTDCNNAVVYQAEIGGSKEKDRYDAFNEALDGSLKTVKLSKYTFEGVHSDLVFLDDQGQVAIVDEAKIKSEESNIEQDKLAQNKVDLDKSNEIKTAQKKANQTAMVKVRPIASKTSVSSSKANISNTEEVKPEVEQAKAIEKSVALEVPVKVTQPVKEEVKIPIVALEKKDTLEGVLLYAQAIPNGFQFVDTTPKIVLKLENTMQHNYFNADKKNGVVYMKNGGWVFEYFLDGELIVEKLNVKFCD